jgi:hypothetical protein
VGHRALVAYERPTGGYTVRYSQWGAHGYRLLDTITASTPLGGRRGDGDAAPCVRAEPIEVVADLEAFAATSVDPLTHEAAFVVTEGFDVRAYEPLAFWHADPTVAFGGALVALRRGRGPSSDARELHAWRRGATATGLPDDPVETLGTDERERTHQRLFDALDADVVKRQLERIPPRTRDA